MLQRILALLIGYGFGLILIGYLIGKSHHKDLRKMGSGNVGMTNTMRNFGFSSGLLTLICDLMKAVAASVVVYFIFRTNTGGSSIRLLMLYAAFGSVLGHDFPLYFKFRGGKGISTSAGLILVAFPQTFPLVAGVFVLTVFLSRYISLGSILAAGTFIAEVLVFGLCGFLPYEGTELCEAMVIGTCVGVLAIVKHHANLSRLISGTENPFTFHPKTKK